MNESTLKKLPDSALLDFGVDHSGTGYRLEKMGDIVRTKWFMNPVEVLVNKKSYKSYQEKINLLYGKDSLSKTVRLSKENVTVQFDVFPKGGVFIFGGKKSDPNKSFSLSPDKEYVLSYEKKGFARKSVRFYPRDYVDPASAYH